MAKSSQSGGWVGWLVAIAMVVAGGAVVGAYVLQPGGEAEQQSEGSGAGSNDSETGNSANLGGGDDAPAEGEEDGADAALQGELAELKSSVDDLNYHTGLDLEDDKRTIANVPVLKPIGGETGAIRDAINSGGTQNLIAMILGAMAFLASIAAIFLALRNGGLSAEVDELKSALKKTKNMQSQALKVQEEEIGEVRSELAALKTVAASRPTATAPKPKTPPSDFDPTRLRRSEGADMGPGGGRALPPPAPPPHPVRSTRPSIEFTPVQRLVLSGADMSSSEFRGGLDALGRRIDLQVSGSSISVAGAGGSGGSETPITAVVDPATGLGYLVPNVKYLRNFGASYEKIQNDMNEVLKPFFELEVTDTGQLSYDRAAVIKVVGQSVEVVETGKMSGYIY